jgi:hypothetical protein
MMLRAILGIDAEAPAHVLWVNPTLPDWLPEITLSHLQVGKRRLAIRFTGQGPKSQYEVLEGDGIEVLPASERHDRERAPSTPEAPIR